jgi:hypothetical protein
VRGIGRIPKRADGIIDGTPLVGAHFDIKGAVIGDDLLEVHV